MEGEKVLNFSVTFFITIVNITFLYFVLKRLLFKPVTKFMENRTKSVQDEIESAKRATARAEALEAEFMKKMANAEAEGQKVIQASRDRAEKEYASIIEKARVDAEKVAKDARQRLEDERRVAERVLREEAASLSIQAASRVVAENLDTEKNRRLVERFLETVGAA
jgi:F-type H+-transporting ATPase subunit b